MARTSNAVLYAAAALAGCTCMRLRKVARGVSRIYDGFLAPSGLTSTQFGILASIRARPGIAIGELADRLMMDATTLTRNLRPLQRSGYIDVAPVADDRRRRGIGLTRSGLQSLQSAQPMWRRAQTYVAHQLGNDDVAVLHASLDRAAQRLSRSASVVATSAGTRRSRPP